MTTRDDEDLQVSDESKDDPDHGEAGDAQQSLVGALRSLERTLTDHTQQLTKRLRRELTSKGASGEAKAQTGVDTSSLPAKTGQRGDKVAQLIIIIIIIIIIVYI